MYYIFRNIYIKKDNKTRKPGNNACPRLIANSQIYINLLLQFKSNIRFYG